MDYMKFISQDGNEIIFDDYTDNRKEYNSWWVEMCPYCYSKYKNILGNRISDGAEGVCSVKGCCHQAEYYVDFNENECVYTEG